MPKGRVGTTTTIISTKFSLRRKSSRQIKKNRAKVPWYVGEVGDIIKIDGFRFIVTHTKITEHNESMVTRAKCGCCGEKMYGAYFHRHVSRCRYQNLYRRKILYEKKKQNSITDWLKQEVEKTRNA